MYLQNSLMKVSTIHPPMKEREEVVRRRGERDVRDTGMREHSQLTYAHVIHTPFAPSWLQFCLKEGGKERQERGRGGEGREREDADVKVFGERSTWELNGKVKYVLH